MAVPYDVPVFPVPNLISATRLTGTQAEFNAALSDGDFAFAGGGGGTYTDEMAQDAVGIMIDASLTYVDATPLLQRAALTGVITAAAGDNATALGSFTKAQLVTAVSDGDPLFVGDAPTAHTHLLAAGATDVTVTAANLNALDDGLTTALHFHDADRARAVHTGTQLAATISDFSTAVAATAAVTANTAKVTNATHTGDAAGDTILTLATVNANVGSFGLAGSVAQFTVNAKGLITAAANVAISIASTAISDSTAAGRAFLTALTATAQTALLDVFTSAAKGLVPASGGGTTNFLRADGTFAAPGGGGSSVTRIAGASGAAGTDITLQKLTADAAANLTTTLVTVMTTTGVGVGVWKFQYHAIYQALLATTGADFAINHTGAVSSIVVTTLFPSTGGAAATGIADQIGSNTASMVEGKGARALNTKVGSTLGTDTALANCLMLIEGTIVVTTTGSLELRHASELAASTTVKINSNLVLTFIG